MNIQHGVAGFINMQVRHADGTMTETGWFKNLILDTFFNRFAANNTMINAGITCRVGTGVTPPANGDTALVSQVASKARTGGSDVVGSIDITNNRIVAKSINQFIFDVGAVSANIGEVGFEFAPGTSGVNAGSLNSRSLTKDSFGTPTPITVRPTDQLIVNYTIELYIPLVDYSSVVAIDVDGTITNHAVIGRVADNYNGTIEQILSVGAGADAFVSYGSSSVFGGHGIAPTSQSGTSSGTSSLFTNVSGGKERAYSASINQLNATGGIKVITVPMRATTGRGYKYEFTPVIPKTTSFSLTLQLRFTCVRV